MATEPTPTDLDFLDFRPSCLIDDNCHNTATHYGVTICCEEHAVLTCGQCRTECLTARDPWGCPRCGRTWTPKAKGFRWGRI